MYLRQRHLGIGLSNSLGFGGGPHGKQHGARSRRDDKEQGDGGAYTRPEGHPDLPALIVELMVQYLLSRINLKTIRSKEGQIRVRISGRFPKIRRLSGLRGPPRTSRRPSPPCTQTRRR